MIAVLVVVGRRVPPHRGLVVETDGRGRGGRRRQLPQMGHVGRTLTTRIVGKVAAQKTAVRGRGGGGGGRLVVVAAVDAAQVVAGTVRAFGKVAVAFAAFVVVVVRHEVLVSLIGTIDRSFRKVVRLVLSRMKTNWVYSRLPFCLVDLLLCCNGESLSLLCRLRLGGLCFCRRSYYSHHCKRPMNLGTEDFRPAPKRISFLVDRKGDPKYFVVVDGEQL